jgi:MFS family permease
VLCGWRHRGQRYRAFRRQVAPYDEWDPRDEEAPRARALCTTRGISRATGRLQAVLRPLRHVVVDVTPLRESRDFRLLVTGQLISSLGTQVALVALPVQIFLLSHSPLLVGLLGAFELAPAIAVSLLGGAMADRLDRRNILIAAQFGVIAAASALAAVSLAGRPPVVIVMLLGGVLAGSAALDTVTRAAMVPRIVAPARLRQALAFDYAVYQITMVVGPGIGGLLIAAFGVADGYLIDAGSCLAMAAAALAMTPQPPSAPPDHASITRSILESFRFVRRNNALAGSFAIDLMAMTTAWPRSMFAVLSLTLYHAGAGGTGLLFAALAAGGTLAALTAGWLDHARRLGRIVIVAVVVWGAAVACAGLVRTLAPALLLLAIAGFADGVSAVCRTTINQTVTPDRMRGRMSALYSLVVNSGPRLGDIESGVVAGLTSAATSVLTGGIACVVGAGAVVLAFPDLVAYDRGIDEPDSQAALAESAAGHSGP